MKHCIKMGMFISALALATAGYAQTDHGNGSQLIKGSRTDYWNSNTYTWTLYDSSTREYTSDNQPLQNVYYRFNSAGGNWAIKSFSVYKYDDKGHEIQYMDTNLNSADAVFNSRINSEYSNGYSTKKSSRQFWDMTTKTWKMYDRYTYNYNTSGQYTSILIELYSAYKSAWVGQNFITATFNASGEKILELYETYDTIAGKWNTDFRISFQYNSDGTEMNHIGEQYINNVWEKIQKQEFTYETDKQISTQTNYKWDKGSNSWVGSFKTSYTYDDKKNLETIVNFSWNKSTSKWENYSSNIYSLDITGWPTSELRSSWDAGNAKWVYEYKNASLYNNNGYETVRVRQNWDNTDTKFTNYSKQYWWYQDKNANLVSTVKNNAMQLSPNPASTVLNIALPKAMNNAEFSVYDLSGKMLISPAKINLLSGNTFSLDLEALNLPRGTYVLQITGENQAYRELFIRN